jgi:hypothetical protein
MWSPPPAREVYRGSLDDPGQPSSGRRNLRWSNTSGIPPRLQRLRERGGSGPAGDRSAWRLARRLRPAAGRRRRDPLAVARENPDRGPARPARATTVLRGCCVGTHRSGCAHRRRAAATERPRRGRSRLRPTVGPSRPRERPILLPPMTVRTAGPRSTAWTPPGYSGWLSSRHRPGRSCRPSMTRACHHARIAEVIGKHLGCAR